VIYYFDSYSDLSLLHSFPTRRSSDLVPLIFDAHSPRVVSGLANGVQYAFVMNATNRDSRGGPSTPVFTAVPRLAGASWTTGAPLDRKSTRLNSSHDQNSYAVFCLKKK